MTRLFFLCAALVLVFSGCSSVSVSRDYDVSFDFSALKTFAWQYAEQPQTGNPRIDNDLVDERVRAAVDVELATKGFRLVEQAEADFLVAYFIDYKQRISSSGGSMSVGTGRGSAGRYGGIGYSSASTVSDYEEGYLMLDIMDPADEKNIWRGVGRGALYEITDPEKITKRVNRVVSRILDLFPSEK